MTLRVTNIRLPVEAPESAVRDAVADRLAISANELQRWRILRKSLDARRRTEIEFVYSVIVDLPDESDRIHLVPARRDVQHYRPAIFYDPPPGNDPLAERPVVVGSGPAGLLAALYLAQTGYRPLVIERGRPVKDRVEAVRSFNRQGAFEPENNYLFGEGGAGCFSDGKLTCRMTGPDVEWILDRFVDCGAPPSVRFEHRPHLGSNKLPLICRNFRRRIESFGGEYLFDCRLEMLDIDDGRVVGVMTSSGYIPASQVVLAVGHSARDTYAMLYDLGVPFEQKAFQLGLRIEQPQEQINAHKYGRRSYAELLGAADYSVVARGEKDLYTFCTCAGGEIIPSISEPGMFCTNGMSSSRHDTSFANSGVVVTLTTDEFGSRHPLAGVEVQRRYEAAAFRLAGGDYSCPVQSAKDFLAGREPEPKRVYSCSYRRGTRAGNLEQVIPASVVRAVRAGLPIMDRKWNGDFLRDAVLAGPEMRGSAPVRIPRDSATRECPGLEGLYPVGEGAGYAGGIVSAAVDGLRSAKAIVSRFAPLEPVNRAGLARA